MRNFMHIGSRSMRRSRGFSLIELLIGLVISMMGLAAVSTMMMNFSKKRTSIAQTLAALYHLNASASSLQFLRLLTESHHEPGAEIV